jgi:hypothetical protein
MSIIFVGGYGQAWRGVWVWEILEGGLRRNVSKKEVKE